MKGGWLWQVISHFWKGILYNAVNKCITRDIGMGNYEKQGKQEAAYPIPISFPPMPHQFYKDIGRDEVCQPLWFSVGTTKRLSLRQ